MRDFLFRPIMRRAVLGLCVAVPVIVLAVLLMRRPAPPAKTADQLAPQDATVFIELPDLAESARRWPLTALYQIGEEPSVRRFLARPLSQIPAEWTAILGSCLNLQPGSAFWAATRPDSNHWVGGIRFQGDLRQWRNFASLLQQELHRSLISVTANGETPIGSQAEGRLPVYCALQGSWFLVSPQIGLVRDAMARSAGTQSGLISNPAYQESRAEMPARADLYTFVSGQAIQSLRKALSLMPRVERLDSLMTSTVLADANIQDTVYAHVSAGQPQIVPERTSLDLTSPDTLVYASARLDLLALRQTAQRFASQFGIAETAASYFDEVSQAGIDFSELSRLVKNAELVVNQVPATDGLNGVFCLEVSNPSRFDWMIRTLLEQKFPGRWSSSQNGPDTIYQFQTPGYQAITFGLVGSHLVVAPNAEAFEATADKVRQSSLTTPVPGASVSDKSIKKASEIRLYLDSRVLFQRGYSLLRPILICSASFLPQVSQYIDPLQLPETDEITRHLTPISLTHRVTAHGFKDESVGPISAYEAGLLGIAVSSAYSWFQETEESR